MSSLDSILPFANPPAPDDASSYSRDYSGARDGQPFQAVVDQFLARTSSWDNNTQVDSTELARTRAESDAAQRRDDFKRATETDSSLCIGNIAADPGSVRPEDPSVRTADSAVSANTNVQSVSGEDASNSVAPNATAKGGAGAINVNSLSLLPTTDATASSAVLEATDVATQPNAEVNTLAASPPSAEPRSDPMPAADADPTLTGDGISVAQQDAPMKKANKTKENAVPAEQKLPAAASTAGENLPGQAERAVQNSNAITSGTPTTNATETSTGSSASTTPLERTAELMNVHAVRLRDSGAEALRVVIKPGTGMQLSLDLHQDENGIVIRALLNRGDFNFLSQHWTSLQQQLEARGVRLAPLVCEEQPHTPSDDGHKHHRSAREEESETEIFGDFDFNAAPPSSIRPRRGKSRGGKWESWA